MIQHLLITGLCFFSDLKELHLHLNSKHVIQSHSHIANIPDANSPDSYHFSSMLPCSTTHLQLTPFSTAVLHSSSLTSTRIQLCLFFSLAPKIFRTHPSLSFRRNCHTYKALLILIHLYSRTFTHLYWSSLTFIQLSSPLTITQLSTKFWVLVKIPAFSKLIWTWFYKTKYRHCAFMLF